MKKISALCLLTVLTACGGGAGENTGAILPPSDIFVPQEDIVADSNAKLTNMVSNSEYQVALFVSNKLGEDAKLVGLENVTGRSATTRGAFIPNTSGSMDYDKAAELVDMASWLNKSDTSAEDIITEFNKDKNKVKAALKLMDGMYCFVGGDAEETARRILEMRGSHTFDKPLEDLIDKTEVLTLNNVDLYTAPWADTLIKLKFDVDEKGRIKSIEYTDADKILEEKPGADIAVGPMLRDGETAFFIETDKLTKEDMTDDNPDGNIISPEYIKGDLTVNHKHEYISYAKELGLRYSDFGVLQTDFKNSTFNEDALTPEGQEKLREFLAAWGVLIDPFIGGYTEKQIDTDTMKQLAQNGEIKFTGLAVGDVRYRDEDAYNGNGIDVPLTEDSMRDEEATLVVNNEGKQILTADFSKDWYKVQVIKNADGTNGFKILSGDGGADERFHLDADKLPNDIPDAVEVGNYIDSSDPEQIHNQMVFATGYYGDDNNPSEAVGLVKYQYRPNGLIEIPNEGGNGSHYESDPNGNINLTIGFGGKR